MKNVMGAMPLKARPNVGRTEPFLSERLTAPLRGAVPLLKSYYPVQETSDWCGKSKMLGKNGKKHRTACLKVDRGGAPGRFAEATNHA
jgi:hypothetical protein